MGSATTELLHSKYFSQIFNTAIFDGPLRFYFTQHQEADALKVYFSLQKQFGREAGDLNKTALKPVFLMLYPDTQSFGESFEEDSDMAIGDIDGHPVVGLRGPIDLQRFQEITDRISEKLHERGCSIEIEMPT